MPTWETYFAVVQFMLPLHAKILPIPEMGVTVYDFQHMIRNVGQFVLVLINIKMHERVTDYIELLGVRKFSSF